MLQELFGLNKEQTTSITSIVKFVTLSYEMTATCRYFM